MKYLKKIVFLTLALIPINTAAEEIIKLTSGEWPPHLSMHLPEDGFAAAMVREAFLAVGITVNYGYYPWKRAYHIAKNGSSGWHGSVVWLYTDERAKSFYYSDPVITESGFLYYLTSKPIVWKSVEDLEGMVLGGTSHTVYKRLERAESQNILKIDRAGNYDVLFDRLLAKRIDAIPNIKSVADYYLYTRYSQKERDKVTYSPTAIETRVYHLILNKKDPNNQKYIERFNKGLKIIKENGTYDLLLHRLETGYFYQNH